MQTPSLSEQLDNHMRNSEDFDLAKTVDAEARIAAIDDCIQVIRDCHNMAKMVGGVGDPTEGYIAALESIK